MPEPIRRRVANRLPPWTGDFARQAFANALGTLIAALAIFLGGVLVGAIQDVPARSVIAAIAVMASLIAALLAATRLVNAYPRFVENRRTEGSLRRPVERVHEAFEAAESQWAELATLKAALDAALEREDDDEANRLLREFEDQVATMNFSVEMAHRYVEQLRKIPHEGHHHEKVERDVAAERRAKHD